MTTALKEYIAHKKQLKVLGLFGSIEFDNNFDYKNAISYQLTWSTFYLVPHSESKKRLLAFGLKGEILNIF